MAMKARVTNLDGGIVAVKRSGARRYHRHDPLGSTIALVDDGGTTTDTYIYWPYGEERTTTGNTVNPFCFGGRWGYYRDTSGRAYIRARYLQKDLGRWMTPDPLSSVMTPFIFADCDPVGRIDPTGLTPSKPGKPCPDKLKKWKDTLLRDKFLTYKEFDFCYFSACKSWSSFGKSWNADIFEDCIKNADRRKRRTWWRGISHGLDAFWYGNWCGQNKDSTLECAPKGWPGDENDTVPPIDCIDGRCKLHDRCTSDAGPGKFWSKAGCSCHCQLAVAATVCINSCKTEACKRAARLVSDAFAGICRRCLYIHRK